MEVKFWGVRGSIPTPSKDTAKYGGNTSCVSVKAKDELIVLDGGSGLRMLGIELLKQIFAKGKFNPIEMHLFFSHVHWDHIQGIPFFKPIFIKGNIIHMYGEKKARTSLEETLIGQQQYPNFPITIEEISINGANIDFTDMNAGQKVLINSVSVENTKLSHPDGVFCYKISDEKHSIVYATDTEHRNVLDPRLLKISKDADVLIYDAQYTPEEYCGKVGMPKFDWGHSTYEWAVDTAIASNMNKLVLFHHEPEHTDKMIDEIEAAAKKIAGKIKVQAAREGSTIEL